MSKIPLAPVGRLIEKGGAKRVSQDAKKTLSKVLEELAIQISERAVLLAKHAGRKTVKQSDIDLAKKEIWD